MITMEQATDANNGDIAALLADRREWLRSLGLDQWSTRRNWSDVVAASISTGNTWIARGADDRIIGTLALSPVADPDFWTPDEASESAVYMSKMATALHVRGEGVGRAMIAWARNWGASRGYELLRWDAWRTNAELIDYYQKVVGATLLRTVAVPHRQSGALFEMSTLSSIEDQAETLTNNK